MLSILNGLTLQTGLHIFLTNTKIKTQQQRNKQKSNIKTLAGAGN